jgi:hypothetical protein
MWQPAAATGTSLARATWKARRQARQRKVGVLQHIRSSPDTTVIVAGKVAFDDNISDGRAEDAADSVDARFSTRIRRVIASKR